ncbi:flagellar assembly peptidoglycan hydrolase FlgJ [Entomohabitans teleogrylli]|uniref:flagellar assembly peptidoglycan hydrolase FlgJ n=1 Tax=Entomohabitans teleogrylli TaxID=1384589 RepID=UPI00073D502C|nr:flagellar assembly peptidoglycan hydrolase FlgJ [Entomohabitans teleogrylli]
MLKAGPLPDGAAWDARALNDLKTRTAQDPRSNLQPVAREVEGMFVQMMLKSMRDALPRDGLFSSEQTRLYTSLYDQQIARQMSARGLGLAEMMVSQLSAPSAAPGEQAGVTPLTLDNATVTSYQNQTLTQMVRSALPDTAGLARRLPENSRDFLAQLTAPAREASAHSGIPHHLILAQAALESGWGQRQIRTRDGGPSYNLFGIKASGNWQGDVTDITTTEYENGIARKTTASFRVYHSYQEALTDYVRLLTGNPRYAAVAGAASAEQGARALQEAGYATDPNYARKLTVMIQQLKGMGENISRAYQKPIDDLF